METEKIQLKKENETYLITLYGKALDSRTKNPILNDTFADAVIRQNSTLYFRKTERPRKAQKSPSP